MALNFDDTRLCVIGDIDGFTPAISSLVSMMRYARKTTLDAAKNLSVEQLDYLHDKQSNSIAMLLFHIAAVDKLYQNAIFEGRINFNAEESALWQKGLLENRDEALKIRGNDFNYYKELLADVREKTFVQLQEKDDDWLKKEFYDDMFKCTVNNWFYWFHVCEDEINHRGQISWLKKRLPKK